jgi:hypothetical protein
VRNDWLRKGMAPRFAASIWMILPRGESISTPKT